MTEPTPKKKPTPARQVALLVLALAIFAAAAFVIVPKFRPTTRGPVRLDVANGTPGSLLEMVLNLRVPTGEAAGSLPSSIAPGNIVTAYEGLGPVEVVSIGYVSGADGNAVSRPVGVVLEPGGIMTLRLSPTGVEVDAGAP